MNVKELIEKLSKIDGDRVVCKYIEGFVIPITYFECGELYETGGWGYKPDNTTIADYFDDCIIPDKIDDIVVIG